MNKQELIDRTVEKFGGKWPICEPTVLHVLQYRPDLDGNRYNPYFFEYSSSADDLCDKDGFTKRARELGWINGYKYGVEYETNGNKPDLVGQVIIEPFYRGAWQCRARVDELDWDFDCIGYNYPVKKFRIVDERYKPVDVEQAQADWYDYDKQQAIALPPVGVECEYNNNGKFIQCKLVFSGKQRGMIEKSCGSEQAITFEHAIRNFRPLDWNRKADEERLKFVEAAESMIKTAKVCGNDECGIARYLYEQGCRFTGETK